MKQALADFALEDTREARLRVVEALGAAVLFVCVAADKTAERTGFEPLFSIAHVAGRAFVLGGTPSGGRSLLLFSDRKTADAWSARASGFVAEPLAGAMAVNIAELAGAELMIIDPLDLAFVIDKPVMEWQCPRSRRPGPLFPEAVRAWLNDRQPALFDDVVSVFTS
jgi:hypothetical protein